MSATFTNLENSLTGLPTNSNAVGVFHWKKQKPLTTTAAVEEAANVLSMISHSQFSLLL